MTPAPQAGIRPHPDRPTLSRRGSATVLGFGVIAACAVACSMPLLLAAGAAGAGAVLGGMEAIGSGLLLATGAGLAVWRMRRRRAGTGTLASHGSCDCGSC